MVVERRHECYGETLGEDDQVHENQQDAREKLYELKNDHLLGE
jgi:hypothetical protein